VFEHGRPEDANANHAPQRMDDQKLRVARNCRVPGIGGRARKQGDDDQYSRRNTICDPSAGQEVRSVKTRPGGMS
jgi:hypothetical protein